MPKHSNDYRFPTQKSFRYSPYDFSARTDQDDQGNIDGIEYTVDPFNVQLTDQLGDPMAGLLVSEEGTAIDQSLTSKDLYPYIDPIIPSAHTTSDQGMVSDQYNIPACCNPNGVTDFTVVVEQVIQVLSCSVTNVVTFNGSNGSFAFSTSYPLQLH